MAPAPCPVFKTEVITASWGWQAYLGSVRTGAAGLVIAQDDKSINHCWRIVRRGDLAHYGKGNLPADIEVHHQDLLSKQCGFQNKHVRFGG